MKKNNFERDIKWFMSVRNIFNFDGVHTYYNKKGKELIVPSRHGKSGIQSFYDYDTNGIISPTRHPNLLTTLLKVKGSVNLHIKMYAEDRAKCNMNKIELRALCIKYKCPSWFREAVEAQKVKYY